MKKTLLIGLFILTAISLYAHGTETHKSKGLIKGAYKTFNEFILNKPSIIDPFYVKYKARKHKAWKGTYSLTPRFSETNKRIKKIWGFYDGNNAYILHQSEFYPIKIENGQYSFIGYDFIDNSGATSAGVMGGAIGAGIYGAVALSKAKSKKIKYTIDKATGEPIHPYKSTLKNLNGVKLIIYRKAKKELGVPFEFTVNDSLKYSFIPNSFVKLNFDENTTSVKICYGINFSKSLIVNLDKEFDKYIKCSLLEKDKKPQLIEVRTSTGEFDSLKPEKEQKKREKNNW